MFVAHYENTMRNARHTVIDKAVLNEIIDRTRAAAEAQARRIIDDAQDMAALMIANAQETVLRILGDASLETPSNRPQAMELMKLVADKHGVRVSDITGASRNATMVAIRHEAMALVYSRRPDLSLPQIGRLFGGRDHTTILHAVRKSGVYRPMNGYRPLDRRPQSGDRT